MHKSLSLSAGFNQTLLAQAVLIGCLSLSTPALADTSIQQHLSTTHQFSIPAQPLNEALLDFARQSGMQISVDTSLISNLQSASVSGHRTTAEALDALLAGSGLRWKAGHNGLTLEPVPESASTAKLPTATVIALRRPDAQFLSAEQISKEPTRNGSITELLRRNPNVQFNANANSGYHAGEIAPPYVSFHGQPYYNNNFSIDGLSNNDIMNPGASEGVAMKYSTYVNGSSGSLPPGNPEAFHVDASLVQELRVYDSNVPAKYGLFTGGVVDADLKNPNTERHSGSVSFRTTRDNWTQIHHDDRNENPMDGDATSEYSGQPKFIKRIYHFDVNQPLSERSALMFSYDRIESKIPKFQPVLGGKENERRRSETFLLKGLFELNERNSLVASLMYSPHENLHIPTNSVRDGKMTISGGGWQGFMDWEHDFGLGKVNTKLALAQKTNERDWSSSEDFIQHNNAPPELGWCSTSTTAAGCTAREGGYPTDYTRHTTYTLKQDYVFNPVTLGFSEHQFDAGWHIETAKARYKREDDHITNYSSPASRTGFDLTNCFDCNPDENWSLVRRMIYPKTSTNVSVDQYAFYLADRISIGRLTLTPGVRVDYDEFLGNLNVTPRFAFNLDVLDNGNLFGGANRYYAGNMVYYALRAALPAGTAYGNTSGANMRRPDQAWEDTVKTPATMIRYDNLTSLDTPYSDELNIGWSQQLGNQRITLKYVYREGEDLFKQGRGEDNERYLTNDGRSRGETTTLQIGSIAPWRLGAMELGYRVGAKYHETSNNNRYAYDNISFEEQLDWMAIIDGKLYKPDEIPVLDFNQRWSAFLELDTDLPALGLSWTHRLNYADGYQAYLSTPVNCATAGLAACGDYSGRAYEYQHRSFKDSLTLDWRINWSIPVHNQQYLDFTVDVLNVLDNKIGANVGSGANGTMGSNGFVSGYETGRQFWLGAAYRW